MRLIIVVAAVAAFSSAAFAQTTSPGPGSSNPAVNVKPAGSPESTGSVQPGANSFTESQAKSRIEAQGFAQVMELKKDDQGVWRGRAMKDGRTVNVMLDFRGNVSAQ